MSYPKINATPIKIGAICKNRAGQNFEIIEYLGRDKGNRYRIRFESGYEIEVLVSTIITGSVKDRFFPSMCGIGYMGNAKACRGSRIYNLWDHMLKRCYNINNADYYRYGGLGVRVCDRWHCYEYFLEDLPYIDGYNEEAFNQNLLQLDKDKKQQGVSYNQMIYSLETCTFVTSQMNNYYRRTPNNYVPVSIMDTNNGKITDFQSLNEGARFVGVDISTFTNCMDKNRLIGENCRILRNVYKRL